LILTTFGRPGYLRRAMEGGASGFATVADLAAALYLSPGTVRNHLSSVMQKLDARNRADALRIAEEPGWL
jgi:two-component system response regulator DesR